MTLPIEWEPRSQRYRFTDTKRFANERQIRALVQDGIAQRAAGVRKLEDELISGKLSLISWQRQTAQELKLIHQWNWMLGVGGYPQIRDRDRELLTARIDSELKYFGQFGDDLATGKISVAQFRARAAQYRAAGGTTYEAARYESHAREGYKWGSRHRTVSESCSECREYEGRGVVRFDEVIPPGLQCSCRSNCRCYVRYYKNRPGADGVAGSNMLDRKWGWCGVAS